MDLTEQGARLELGDIVQPDNRLSSYGPWVEWPYAKTQREEIELDGTFTADELIAMAWWMKNKGVV